MTRVPFIKPRRDPIAALYGDIVAAARAPQAYRDFGVTDDFEGRFERLALMATLALRRLKALGPAGEAAAQPLVDRLFADLDDALRRLGVGDLSVGKKMKALARAFYGRAAAYTAALDAGDTAALRASLARNLLASRVAPEAVAAGLIAEVEALVGRLAAASLDELLAGGVMASHSIAERSPQPGEFGRTRP